MALQCEILVEYDDLVQCDELLKSECSCAVSSKVLPALMLWQK